MEHITGLSNGETILKGVEGRVAGSTKLSSPGD
jgi:hypothetical protein